MPLDIPLVKQLMKQQRLSQRDLAGMAGVTEAAMSRYLAGERQPRADKVANMATALRTTSDALLGHADSTSEIDSAIQLVARNAKEIPASLKRHLIHILIDSNTETQED